MSADAIAVARAIKYAADNGAVILQCSWGYISGAADEIEWGVGYDSEDEWIAGSPLEKESLDYFIHNAGSANGPIEGGIAVYAAGNEWAPKSSYPGAAEDNIAVAATAADFTPAVYTNYGPGTNVSAPGGDQDYYYEYSDEDHARGEMGCILSTLPYHVSPSGYGYMEGTSMATPQVSGVLALAISYAAEQRRHFKATELMELMEQTATPIDEYMQGTKLYYRYVVDMGLVRPMTMELSAYKGKMGAGQINAAALLAAVDGGGVEMLFPNIYVALQGEFIIAASQYFPEGNKHTYTVTIADESVASCLVEGTKLRFKGNKCGSTRATVKASDGSEQSFNITVREGASSSGWV
jgi:subtilisin family serine protease